jgi:hypothetical protein
MTMTFLNIGTNDCIYAIYCIYALLTNSKIMWIRTVNGIEWIEVEQTAQGLWIPKR